MSLQADQDRTVPPSTVVPLSKNYTPEEFDTALLAIMNLVGNKSHDEREMIMLMLPRRIQDCVLACLETWEQTTRPKTVM